MPSVTYRGKDLYALGLIPSLPTIKESKGFEGGGFVLNDFSIDVINIDNIFSFDHPSNILGSDWRYKSLTAYDSNGEKYIDGKVYNITNNQKTKIATLHVSENLKELANEKIEYKSSADETPAKAAQNIMDDYDFSDYDSGTILRSNEFLDDNSVNVRMNINKSDGLTLFQAIDKLAQYACADVWFHNGSLYFRTWEKYTGSALTIPENRIISIESISSPDINLYNDYEIDYYGGEGTPTTDSDNDDYGIYSRTKFGTHSLSAMRSQGSHNMITFKSQAAAAWIGGNYIKRSHTNYETQPEARKRISGELDYNVQSYITLNSYIRLTYSPNNWNEKEFEIFSFTRDESSQKLKIVAYEVAS